MARCSWGADGKRRILPIFPSRILLHAAWSIAVRLYILHLGGGRVAGADPNTKLATVTKIGLHGRTVTYDKECAILLCFVCLKRGMAFWKEVLIPGQEKKWCYEYRAECVVLAGYYDHVLLEASLWRLLHLGSHTHQSPTLRAVKGCPG